MVVIDTLTGKVYENVSCTFISELIGINSNTVRRWKRKNARLKNNKPEIFNNFYVYLRSIKYKQKKGFAINGNNRKFTKTPQT